MKKQGILVLALGVMIGANLVMGAWVVSLWSNPRHVAEGQTANAIGNYLVGMGGTGQGDQDAFYIYDTDQKKLAVYTVRQNQFQLLGVRDTQYDWKYTVFPSKGQKPTLEQVVEDQKKR